MKLEYKKIQQNNSSVSTLECYTYDIEFLRSSEKAKKLIWNSLSATKYKFIFEPTLTLRKEMFKNHTTLEVDKDFYKKIDNKISTFIATHSGKNIVKRDIVGGAVSMGSYLSGSPKNMLNRRKTFGGKKRRVEDTHKTLYLVYDGRMSSIYRYTLPILGLIINALERDTNHRFKVNIGEIGEITFLEGRGRNRMQVDGVEGIGPVAPAKKFNLANFITLKEYNQRFDFYDHFIWMTVPAFNGPVFINFFEWFYKIENLYPKDNQCNYWAFSNIFKPENKMSIYMSSVEEPAFEELDNQFGYTSTKAEILTFINDKLEDIIIAWLRFLGADIYDY